MPLLDYSRFGITAEDVGSRPFAYIIGFDLGDGELAAAYWDLSEEGFTDPKNLYFNKHQDLKVLSGLYGSSRIGYLGGSVGSISTQSDAEGHLFLNFKVPPARLLDGEKYEGTQVTKLELIQELFRFHLSNILNNNNVRFDGRGLVVVGCPSSPEWLDNGMDVLYARILQRAIAKLGRDLTVVVLPESRASLMKVYKESYNDFHSRLDDGIIVIDHGSSTLDVTVTDFADNHQWDFSIPLGARLIESTALDIELKKQNRDQRDLESLETQRLLFRGTKEAHYTYPEGSRRISIYFKEGKGGSIDARISAESMHNVTHKEEVEYTTTEGKTVGTWSDLHIAFLADAASSCGIDPATYKGTIMLTGGASSMQFVRENAAHLFPNASITDDHDPSYCVSRGLVWVARADLEAMKLGERVRQQLWNAIQNDLWRFRDILGGEVTPVIYSYLLSQVKDWAENGANVTPRELQRKMSDALVNPRTPEQKEWKRKVNNAIRTGIKNYFTYSSLNPLTYAFGGFNNGSLRELIATTVNSIFSQAFPGKVDARHIKDFNIDNALWNKLVKDASSENGAISRSITGAIDFSDLLMGVIVRILYWICSALALIPIILTVGIYDPTDEIEELFDKSDKLISDKKRMKVYKKLINDQGETTEKIRGLFSSSKIGEDGQIARAIIEGIEPALDAAVNNVSLYF